jgi:hypothetical protein
MKLVAVSKEMHAHKVWRRVTNYQFAAREPVTPIVLAEAFQVGAWMPIAFMEQAGHYVPMAMMSPVPGHNLFVGPEGQWLGGYMPSLLRSYPFRLVQPEGSQQMALCVDADSGLIVDADEKGAAFFTADGKPSQSIATLLEFLRQIETSRMATNAAVASLAEASVIEAWPLQVVEAKDKKTAIKGIHRINEKALDTLDDAALLKLRKSAGLRLAYAQLMSMQQLPRFDQLMRLRQQLAQAPKMIMPEELRFD